MDIFRFKKILVILSAMFIISGIVAIITTDTSTPSLYISIPIILIGIILAFISLCPKLEDDILPITTTHTTPPIEELEPSYVVVHEINLPTIPNSREMSSKQGSLKAL